MNAPDEIRPPSLGWAEGIIRRLADRHGRDAVVRQGFNHPHSWRGYYLEAAFEPCGETTLGDILECLTRALTEEFMGYKGGDFEYNMNTPAHLDEWGYCADLDSQAFVQRMASIVLEFA